MTAALRVPADARHAACRALRAAALVAGAGVVASGPLGLWLVSVTRPQPAWRDAAAFVDAYHPVQGVPFLSGFLLLGGMAAMVGALHALAPADLRARTAAALVFAGAFAGMIGVNYAVQTTLLPALVGDDDPASRAVLGVLTMANPRSLGWALEMWGYAMLGAATWLVAPVFRRALRGRAARVAGMLCAANGAASIGSAAWTALQPAWVLGAAGIAAFGVWNALMLALAIAAAVAASPARWTSGAAASLEAA